MKEVVPQARKFQFELRLAKECKAFVCRDLSRLSRPFAIANDSLIRVHSSSDSSLPSSRCNRRATRSYPGVQE